MLGREPTEGRETLNAPTRIASLWLPSELITLIVAHLRAAHPQEGVGLLAIEPEDHRIARHTGRSVGRIFHATRFYPGTNVDASPTRYTMAPQEVVAALNDMEAHGWRLGAIVHSHPSSPATPSATDLREAAYPDALMVIISFQRPEPEIRAWQYNPFARLHPAPSPNEIPIQIAPDRLRPDRPRP